MRIIFWGTPEFAVKSLAALYENNFEIAAAVTVPDKPQGRGLVVKSSAVKNFARQKGIKILQPERLKDSEFIEKLKNLKADVFVIVAFKILPPEIFNIPPSGTINVHASLLPKYRGAAPINWAIINGERETGVTTIRIDAKVDSGDILLQKSVKIDKDMTAGELHDILASEGASLIVKTLNELPDLKPKKQDSAAVTKAPKLNPEITRIDFSNNSSNVYNFIRGLSPYPGAYTYFKSKKLKIFKADLTNSMNSYSESGIVSEVTKNYIEITCTKGSIRVLQLQPEGKRIMSTREFINGTQIKVGDRLGSV